jgi:uncharacterized membrane protein
MSAYSLYQWLLFFFFYCLCGWVWESCYVSARQRRWVNRGFLHGPLLPIYGSGAIIILLATIRVQDNPALICLFGMLSATVLEYFTGAAMEALFKVRYWDYSNQRFNLNGHICLSSSLAWGVFSMILVRLIHPPVAALLTAVPVFWGRLVSLLLVAGTVADVVQSTRAALDLREMLTRLTEENEDLRRLAKRAEVISTFAEDDLRKFRERTEIEKILLSNRMEAERARRSERQALRSLKRQELLEENLSRRIEAKLTALHSIAETLTAYGERLDATKELTGKALAERKAELSEALDRLRTQENHILSRSAKSYSRALRILRGNPSATAAKYAEAMENLRKVGGLHRD